MVEKHFNNKIALVQSRGRSLVCDKCLRRILSYFGRIMRRDDNLEKLVVVGGVGKRARGRSLTTWSGQVQEGSSSSKFHQA
jgi:hypothetical protein